jgi:YD repeat-containing protein
MKFVYGLTNPSFVLRVASAFLLGWLSCGARSAAADTMDDVWNVTVTMSISGEQNPLEDFVFRTYAQADAAMRAAHVDAPFLVQDGQTVSTYGDIYTSFSIPPADVDEWGDWVYSIDSNGCNGLPSEEAAAACALAPRNPCGMSTIVPITGWELNTQHPYFEKYDRYWSLTAVYPTYQSGEGYVCGPTTSNTATYHMVKYRRTYCPSEAPWHGDSPNGYGLCDNSMTAIIHDKELLGGCVAEEDGRDAMVGNPCDAGTGNKIERETDYNGVGIEFTRTYNSNNQFRPFAGFGENWTHNYAEKLRFQSTTSPTAPYARIRADGQPEKMTQGSYRYIGERTGAQLIKTGSEWTLHLPDGGKRQFDASGKLLWVENAVGQRTTLTYGPYGISTITGPFGHTIQLQYSDGRIAQLIDPDGQVYAYSYDSNEMLAGVTYPDAAERVYDYEDPNFAYALTGVTDENGDRYSTFAYDSSSLVVSTEHAGGYGAFSLQYNADASTTVTDALQNSTTYQFASLAVKHGWAGRRRPTTFTTGGQTATRTYLTGSNTPHRLASSTDENGVASTYLHPSPTYKRTSRTEASGTTNARVTSYQYLNSDRHLLTEVSSPSVKSGSLRKTITGYDANQRPTTITAQGFKPNGTAVTRAVSLAYNTYGQVTSIDGPRTDVTDVTTLDYYECTTGGQCGQLESVTNALGHVTTYDSYDDHGRVLEMTDANGVVTTYAYDLRGRTTSITWAPPAGPARTTTYTYDDAGQLETIEAPNGTLLAYAYDAAHNLVSITDNLGNSIEYGYDLNGNRTSEDVYDTSSTLKKTIDYTYDARNRIDTINSAGSITDLVFDAAGNLTDETDPNSNDTDHDYDSLKRLAQTIDALSGITEYGYDKDDRLTSVEAPNGATTSYVYDDLGNRLSMTSPDTGTTTYSYDAAGNRLSQTDANSVTVAYSYDALNRLTAIDYPGSTLDVTLVYDQGTAQRGHLTKMTDASGTTSFEYDAFGNLVEESKLIDGDTHVTAYAYDEADLLTATTYPSGRTVDYTRNVLGQITTVESTYGGTTVTVADDVEYEPFGPLAGLTFGNSLVLNRTFDQQYRLADQVTGPVQDLAFTLDAAGNIDAIADSVNAGLSQGFAQDALHRVTTDAGSYGTKNFTYDAVGNRLTRVHGAATQTLTYTASSNRLATHDGNTLSVDAAGNALLPTENLSFTYIQPPARGLRGRGAQGHLRLQRPGAAREEDRSREPEPHDRLSLRFRR